MEAMLRSSQEVVLIYRWIRVEVHQSIACTFIPQELGTALLMSVTWRAEPLSLLNRQT